jgi:DNA polymerase III delta subunit
VTTLGVVGSILVISGPSESGPGERELMLSRAQAEFAAHAVSDVTRVDVPPKGTGEDSGEGALRGPVAQAVPALQSGSLFGDATGLLVVDAQSLLKAEAEVLAELVRLADHVTVVAVFVAAGAIPAPLGKALKELGEVVSVARLTERSAATWLASAARERSIRLHGDAAEALIQRFGTDLASLGQALDQMVASGDEITAEAVLARFKNRPDEPSWLYMDSVAGGDRGEALRRLSDFLQHGHPLILLAVIQSDLRRRALAAAAPDYETFASRDGGRRNYGMEKVWSQRNRVRAADLRLALDAVARADLTLKTAPEPTHRVTMERLTVALCRWYGGAARIAS